MFLIFHFLVLINYVSDSSNYVLNRTCNNSQWNVRQNDSSKILLDGGMANNTILSIAVKSPEIDNNIRIVRNPNFKVNLFDKRLSDEMLSIKQTAHDRDVTRTITELKTTKNYIGTPTLEVNQKWPAVELLYKLDEVVEKASNSDVFDYQKWLSEEDSPKSAYTDNYLNGKSDNGMEEQQNPLKDKVVDLRSLSGHGPPKPADLQQHNCSCSRSTISPHAVPTIGGLQYLTPGAFSYNWGSYTNNGMLSYTLLPFYLPYEPYFHNPVNIYKEHTKSTPDENLYYNEENKGKDEHYRDNEYHEKVTKTTTRRMPKKTTKIRHDDNTVIFDIEYDLIRVPHVTTVKTLTTKLENNAKKSENDFKVLCPCSIYSTHCCSSSSVCNSSVLLIIIFYLFIVGDLFI